MSDGDIVLEQHGQILHVILDRPAKKNAFGGTMREDLATALDAAARMFETDEARVVVIRGAGGSFCAGGDVANLLRMKEAGDGAGLLELLARGERVVRAIRAFPGPVIAAIDGPAVGAGLTLALACDLRISSERSKFGMAFVRVGLHPDWGGSWLLSQVVGPSRASELAMTGRLLGAAEAGHIGLLHKVVADDAWADVVAKDADRLAASAPKTLALIKQTFLEMKGRSLDDGFKRERQAQYAAFATADAAEGFRAFLEKRPALYEGR
jgi:2-(1,2-epoxy-1,2-dihydrophenyl)acetyl-CoA isomerase